PPTHLSTPSLHDALPILTRRALTTNVRLRILDNEGLSYSVEAKPLLDLRGFVRTWRIAPMSAPWTDRTAFPAVDADRLRAIVERSEEHTSELQSLAYLVC